MGRKNIYLMQQLCRWGSCQMREMARHGTAWNGMVWYGETITGQEHNTHSGKEAYTLSIKTPLHAPLRPQCNHFAIVCAWTFSLHFAAASTITTAATRNRNKNNKLLALSWHIDNKLIIPRFVSPHHPLPITHYTLPITHHPYAPLAQCTLECCENELGFSYFFSSLSTLCFCEWKGWCIYAPNQW